MISRLNQRERIFVIIGGLAIGLALLYFALVAPYRNALSRIERQIEVRDGQLQEVRTLQGRYLAIQNQMAQVTSLLEKRPDFSALTFIENLVAQTAGRESLLSMRPQSPEARPGFLIDTIEIKLEKLTLRQLLELLANVEGAATPMQVKTLAIKQHFDDRALLDVTMSVTALRRAI